MSSTYVDCTSLPVEWDAVDAIRDRLRNGEPLISGAGGKDVKIPRCVANYDLLIPILAQIGSGSRLAEIDGLREATSAIYSRNHREASVDVIDEAAWAIRDMVFFVKRKTQREEVSLVVWFQLDRVCLFLR